MFTEATREQNRLRMAIDGGPGNGKTYTALRFAFVLAGPNGKVGVIDSEHGSCWLCGTNRAVAHGPWTEEDQLCEDCTRDP